MNTIDAVHAPERLKSTNEDSLAKYIYIVAEPKGGYVDVVDRNDYSPELTPAELLGCVCEGAEVVAVYRVAPISPNPVTLMRGTAVFFGYALHFLAHNVIPVVSNGPAVLLWNDGLRAQYQPTDA